MDTVKVTLSEDMVAIKIIVLGDWHIGDSHCREDLIREQLDIIRSSDDCYCILCGDLINNAVRSGVSDVYGEVMSPMRQLKTLVELLEPIRDKILCMVPGNHEERTYKQDGIDLLDIVSTELGISDRYASDSCLLFLRFGRLSRRNSEGRMASYAIYVNHGRGAGRSVGSKFNVLSDMKDIVDADIYVTAHTHTPGCFKDEYIRTDIPHSSCYSVEKLFVNCGSMLSYGGYGSRSAYCPASNSMPVIYLSGRKRLMNGVV